MPETTKPSDREIGAEEDFGALFEQSLKSPKPGDVVTGRVGRIGRDAVTVDIGYKSEGQIPVAEFMTRDGELTVHEGDEVDVYFEASDTESGDIVLSRHKAEQFKVWREIEKAFERDGAVEGTIVGKVKGGLKVDIGVAAFLPGSHADLRPTRNLDRYIGQHGRFAILKFNRSRGNVVVSRRSVLERERTALKSETLKVLEEGVILEGTVKNITDYGAFVDLGGIDGLLHVTDMSWGRVAHPSEVINVGDRVKVVVLKYDPERERVSLGMKQIMPDPWTTIAERLPINARIRGKVVSLADYGAFVEIEKGIEGLIHVSEMSWTKRVTHPSKVLEVGQEVEVQVLDIDPANRRVSLGLKQTEPNPWELVRVNHPVCSKIRGKIKSITDFGLFVEVEENIDEEAEVGDALDLAADLRAHRVVHAHQLPGIRLGLLEPERDAAVGGVDVEHLDLDLLAHLEHLRGMRHPLGPRHLRDVDQALDAPLDLDEGAVLGEAHDLAADARVDRQALGDRRPRIGHDLFHAERDALALRGVLEDDHLHALADVDDLGGMRDPAPRHVGHVEEPVDAAEIDEGAVVGDVLDRALEDDALLQHLERLGLERRALALEDRSPGHHHVPARAVELEDGEAPALADVAIEVARRPEVGVRAGEERGHADVHLEPALHLADDRPFDRAVALVGLLDLAPDLELLRLLPREDDVARLGVARLEVDVDLVALVHGELALARGELVDRDGALGLVADVDRDRVASDEDDPAGDDLALLRLLQAPLEEGTKVLFGADRAIGLLRRLGHQGTTPCGRDSCGMQANRLPILPSRGVYKRENLTFRAVNSSGGPSAARALRALRCSDAPGPRAGRSKAAPGLLLTPARARAPGAPCGPPPLRA